MMQLAENIPGKPHRWAEAICAWARGELAQWRYVSPEATDADWRDCDYPSRGRPNFEHPDLEYRAAPTHRKPSEPAQDEALKADAARYRVVRGDGADANNAPLRDYCFDADGSLLYGHDLDAACDAALAQIDAAMRKGGMQITLTQDMADQLERRRRQRWPETDTEAWRHGLPLK